MDNGLLSKENFGSREPRSPAGDIKFPSLLRTCKFTCVRSLLRKGIKRVIRGERAANGELGRARGILGINNLIIGKRRVKIDSGERDVRLCPTRFERMGIRSKGNR